MAYQLTDKYVAQAKDATPNKKGTASGVIFRKAHNNVNVSLTRDGLN